MAGVLACSTRDSLQVYHVEQLEDWVLIACVQQELPLHHLLWAPIWEGYGCLAGG